MEVRGYRDVLRFIHEKAGFVECLGRGPGAIWQKKGNTLKKGLAELRLTLYRGS